MTVSIHQATTAVDFEQAKGLFRAYAAYLSANPSGATSICISGFEQEIATLPGPYASPEGVLLLAHVDDAPAGCVALRPIASAVKGERSCEMKRLWTADRYRGQGLGRKLVQSAMDWARAAEYKSVYLDTVPAAMPTAQSLYQSLGFQQVARYNDNPVPEIVYFRLSLSKSRASQSSFISV